MSVIRFAEGNKSYGPNIELEGVPDKLLHTSFFLQGLHALDASLASTRNTSNMENGPIVYEIVKLSSTNRASDF